jgi:hypothetical protein
MIKSKLKNKIYKYFMKYKIRTIAYENLIAQDPFMSFRYASYVLKNHGKKEKVVYLKIYPVLLIMPQLYLNLDSI